MNFELTVTREHWDRAVRRRDIDWSASYDQSRECPVALAAAEYFPNVNVGLYIVSFGHTDNRTTLYLDTAGQALVYHFDNLRQRGVADPQFPVHITLLEAENAR